MSFDAGSYGENVGIEYDVGRSYSGVGQQPVGPGADFGLPLQGVGLPLLVEGHHYHGGSHRADMSGSAQHLFLALFEAYGVDHRFSLHEFESAFHYLPLRGVDHERHAGHVGLGRRQTHEALHLARGVEQRIVHVDVDYACSGVGLRGSDRHGLADISILDQAEEFAASGDIAPFAHRSETVGRYCQSLQTGKPQRSRRIICWYGAWLRSCRLGSDSPDMGRGCAAAASHDVEHSLRKGYAQCLGHVGRR